MDQVRQGMIWFDKVINVCMASKISERVADGHKAIDSSESFHTVRRECRYATCNVCGRVVSHQPTLTDSKYYLWAL